MPTTILTLLVISIIIFLVAKIMRKEINAEDVIAICVAIIITVASIPYDFEDDEGAPTISANLQYDDYCICNNVRDATGAVELITLYDSQYVHAKSVGFGEVTYDDGVTEQVCVSKAKLDVFMIAGQSNAEHSIYSISAVPHKADLGNCYYYGSANRVVSKNYISSSMSMMDMGLTNVCANVDQPFAVSYNKNTGHKIFVINTGIASTAINTWTAGGSSYNYAKEVFSTAMDSINEEYYIPNVKGVVWIQGEADKDTTIGAYKSNFVNLYNELTNGSFCLDPFDYCLISKVRDIDGGNAAIAQKQLAKEINGVYLATDISDSFSIENGLILGDNYHYSQNGDNYIGQALGIFASTL